MPGQIVWRITQDPPPEVVELLARAEKWIAECAQRDARGNGTEG